MTKPRPFLALVAVSLAACGNTHVSRVVTGTPRAAHAGRVRITLESAPAPQAFTEIAILQARGYGTHANLEHVVAGLQDECGRLGGEVVARVRVDQGMNGANGVGVCGYERPGP